MDGALYTYQMQMKCSLIYNCRFLCLPSPVLNFSLSHLLLVAVSFLYGIGSMHEFNAVIR